MTPTKNIQQIWKIFNASDENLNSVREKSLTRSELSRVRNFTFWYQN